MAGAASKFEGIRPLPTSFTRLLACLALFLVGHLARAAPDALELVVEIDPEAELLLDARITRRLIALELSDIELPPRPRSQPQHSASALFFRVIRRPGDELVVELWERGLFYGKRSVSGASGSERLRARRVALAAAELVRRLKQRRLAEARRQERLAEQRRERDRLARLEPPFARLQLRTSATGGVAGPGDFWLLGPSASGHVQFGSGVRLQTGLAWLFGETTSFGPTSSLWWLELSVAPSYVFKLSSHFELNTGLRAAAAIISLGDVLAVDEIMGQRQSWSSRLVGHVGLESKLTRDLRLSVEPEFGLLLRRIPVEVRAGERDKLGGFWLGGSLGLLFDPAAPPRRAKQSLSERP